MVRILKILHCRINVIKSKSIGCIVEALIIFPVVIISASIIGKSELINPTRLLIVSLTNDITFVKFVITSVTIKMYCT